MSDELLSPDAPVKQVTISLNGKERTVCIPRNASADDFKTSIIDQFLLPKDTPIRLKRVSSGVNVAVSPHLDEDNYSLHVPEGTKTDQQTTRYRPIQREGLPGTCDKYVPSEEALKITGRVHSMETFSTVDGHGIRVICFLQGCPRRCKFCSNPDTWNETEGTEMSVAEVAARFNRYVPYMKASEGGLTLSGGEPLMQPEFTAALLREAHRLGVNTTIDTTGFGTKEKTWDIVLPHVDTVLLCPKALNPRIYKWITEQTIHMMLGFAKEVTKRGISVWLRYVLLPDYTDSDEEITRFCEFAHTMTTMKGVELLPFHQLGLEKWKKLEIPYPLVDMQTPPREEQLRVKEILEDEGFTVLL